MNFLSKIFKKISNNFFKGILISAPVIITFYIAWGLIKFFDKQASPLLGTFPYEIPGFGRCPPAASGRFRRILEVLG